MSSSRSEFFFASAPRGLESLLEGELKSLGASDVRGVAGGVAFGGGWQVCYRANLWSRIASRILWRVGEFQYGNESDVYAAAKNDIANDISAFRFRMTERFKQPVEAKALAALDIGGPFMSPRKISDSQFEAIYRMGCKLTP